MIVPIGKNTSETLLESYKRALTLKKIMATFQKGERRYIPCSLYQDIPTDCYIVDCRDGVGVDVQVSMLHGTEDDSKLGTATSSMIHIWDARGEKLMMKELSCVVTQ